MNLSEILGGAMVVGGAITAPFGGAALIAPGAALAANGVKQEKEDAQKAANNAQQQSTQQAKQLADAGNYDHEIDQARS